MINSINLLLHNHLLSFSWLFQTKKVAEWNISICFVMFYLIKMKGSCGSVSSRWRILFHRNMRGMMLYAGIVYFEHFQLWINSIITFKRRNLRTCLKKNIFTVWKSLRKPFIFVCIINLKQSCPLVSAEYLVRNAYL